MVLLLVSSFPCVRLSGKYSQLMKKTTKKLEKKLNEGLSIISMQRKSLDNKSNIPSFEQLKVLYLKNTEKNLFKAIKIAVKAYPEIIDIQSLDLSIKYISIPENRVTSEDTIETVSVKKETFSSWNVCVTLDLTERTTDPFNTSLFNSEFKDTFPSLTMLTYIHLRTIEDSSDQAVDSSNFWHSQICNCFMHPIVNSLTIHSVFMNFFLSGPLLFHKFPSLKNLVIRYAKIHLQLPENEDALLDRSSNELFSSSITCIHIIEAHIIDFTLKVFSNFPNLCFLYLSSNPILRNVHLTDLRDPTTRVICFKRLRVLFSPLLTRITIDIPPRHRCLLKNLIEELKVKNFLRSKMKYRKYYISSVHIKGCPLLNIRHLNTRYIYNFTYL